MITDVSPKFGGKSEAQIIQAILSRYINRGDSLEVVLQSKGPSTKQYIIRIKTKSHINLPEIRKKLIESGYTIVEPTTALSYKSLSKSGPLQYYGKFHRGANMSSRYLVVVSKVDYPNLPDKPGDFPDPNGEPVRKPKKRK